MSILLPSDGNMHDRHGNGVSALHFAEPQAAEADLIDIAFVNNMPDKALEATERQFLRLVAASGKGLTVRIRFYFVPDIPRSEWGRHHVAASYAPIAELWNSRPDALIVTGTEPRTSDLSAEPYWSTLVDLIEWAKANVVSAIWSCLACHVLVRHLDHIERHRLGAKCWGVFRCECVDQHPLLDGLAFPLSIPHSRWNDLDVNQLKAARYEILTQSLEAGVDTFVKRDSCLFVCFQGHPEYDADTLMREYRRDVGRFLRGEVKEYPSLPRVCLEKNAVVSLAAFRERALTGLASLAELPMPPPIGKTWESSAVHIYRNWLSMLLAMKSSRRGSARFARRVGTGRARQG
jgi:homoserine O-succinyltransferase